MNFLAHLFLAGPDDAMRLGSVLADFTHVSNDRLAAAYGEPVARGVIAHRRIDGFTDTHQSFVDAVSLLFTRHRHAGRIVVDITFDHFLYRHWARFSHESFDDFVDGCHRVLLSVGSADLRLPERFRLFCSRFVEYRVMHQYGTLDGIGMALERVGRRISFENRVAQALPDIVAHFDALEQCFLGFFPDVISFAQGPALES